MSTAAKTMLQHWSDMKPAHDKVLEFFEWLDDQGYEVELHDPATGATLRDGREKVVRTWLGIDDAQLERERRELLAQQNSGKRTSKKTSRKKANAR